MNNPQPKNKGEELEPVTFLGKGDKRVEYVTPMERTLLNEVIREAISEERPRNREYWFGRITYSETLNFVTLLRVLRKFYEKNNGRDWHSVLYEADR